MIIRSHQTRKNMIFNKLIFISLISAIFLCHSVEIESEGIIAINPDEICQQKIVFDNNKTTLFTDCLHYEFINQYKVNDSMSINDFYKFVANYQLGTDYKTTIEQELLRHFDAMISPFDPKTKVLHDTNLVLVKTNTHDVYFQNNKDHWLLTKAVLTSK